jgi:hypothetical protein
MASPIYVKQACNIIVSSMLGYAVAPPNLHLLPLSVNELIVNYKST